MMKPTVLSRSPLTGAPRSKNRSVFILIVGVVCGYCLAQLSFHSAPNVSMYPNLSRRLFQLGDNQVATEGQLAQKHNSFQHDHSSDNVTVADQLKKEVRILCWVMTNPENHKLKARHVKRTWGKRCNILLFMSSAADEELPTVKLDVGEGRQNLWAKVKEAFKYVYQHHYNDADFFYKADDDTYAVIENMRYMLYPYNPETPVHFGFKFKPYVKQGYMSGGAGYILSREALRRFVVEGIPNPKMCLQGTAINEDVEIGRCMENLNVTAGDSRDEIGRGRMFPFKPEHHLIANQDKTFWYWSYTYYKTDDGLDCCSDLAVSFHYIAPKSFYVLDYLIYHLKPYGLLRALEPLPAKLKVGQFLPPPVEHPLSSNEDSFDDYDRIYTTTTVKPKEPDAREVDSKEVEKEEDKYRDKLSKEAAEREDSRENDNDSEYTEEETDNHSSQRKHQTKSNMY
ncbi:glycoprotein-N-acetylgalactosamine 3-beta-galactosyltransferase 1 [Drosophila erecta]|uniref:Glycoprotein-N-acetylgalactosamine 3-beta-galactosyltransferase 1 n=1 Tax=Drosophila erecta TaxID=7220 RepID=B3N8T5_DROER|nr:glycoprotein-N-acetylgalactosamine 3-beta-galactosyltransferase 1 [Drosophila erecta]EDV59562.1 uncharacterized protein Dere_GG10669 [Drosophila erecta]